MLLITTRAVRKLREIAEKETPGTGSCDGASGVRLRLSGLGNGGHGIECRFGIDWAKRGDQVEDIGGINLLIDPPTFEHLRRISALLDVSRVNSEDELVLIVERG